MKIKYLIYGLLMLVVTSCAIVSRDFRYKPKSVKEFIFPLHSAEFTQSVEECIKFKKFPCNYPEPEDSLSEFHNTWYSKHLISLKEPILYNQRVKKLRIIRFTGLGTWSNPFSYRIENLNGKISGTYNISNGLGGFKAGKRIKHKEKELSEEDWNLIMSELDKIKFWKIPTHDTNSILDGSEWIFEVLIEDKYHFVTRSSPDVFDGKEYAELCELVIEIFDKEK